MTTIFSRSELATWQSCEMMYYFRYGLGYHPKENSDAIRLGNIGHLLLEIFFREIKEGATKEEALQAMQPQGLTKEDLIATLLARKFAEDFDTSTGIPLFVDEPLIAPVDEDNDIHEGLAADLVWQYHNGVCDVFDWKFTRRRWSRPQIEMHGQLPGYKFILNTYYGTNIKTCKYVFFNTGSENNISYNIQPFTPDMKECEGIIRDQIKEAVRMKARKSLPIDLMKDESTRSVDGKVCAYCAYQIPCRMDRKGNDYQKTLDVMFTQDTEYGYNLPDPGYIP